MCSSDLNRKAYCILLTPAASGLSSDSRKRLAALEEFSELGDGFKVAMRDLDIRGAGNLLGDEQSGHIKEVGYELYQQMLQEAIAALKAGIDEPAEEAWSPTITMGTPVTIPEEYVPDLTLRMQLYRRLSNLRSEEELESFAGEMIDRFGPMPEEVEIGRAHV